jgi:peptide deformylase
MTTPTPLTLLNEFAPILKEEIKPFDASMLDEGIAEVAERLHTTRRLYRAVGLAANQVGIKARMFVMGNDAVEFTCINPEVVSVSDQKIKYSEGCLSFPRLVLKIERPESIRVKYLNEKLEQQEHDLTGVFARCFLHELDHLNGITFTTHVSKLVLAMARKKQAKVKRFKK